MKNTDYFKGKRVLVIGFGRSGLSSANLLSELGSQVKVTDSQDNPVTRQNLKRLNSKDIKVELGRHSREFLSGIELIVVSPGVANDALPLLWGKEAKIPVIGEIELAWKLCPAQIIAITGTCGKTTVTTLIGRLIEAWGKKVFTCGNIGNPFTQEVGKMQEGDFVSLEVSSFQLEGIEGFKPKISLILNLSRNHLDRYNGMQDYIGAKERIFKNQGPSDYLVLNYDDEAVRNLNSKACAKIVYFKKEEGLNPNESAVLRVAEILEIDKRLAMDTLANFKGVEHRMEEVLSLRGVRFINDSKSTTTEATVWALNNLNCPVILISGGREKGNDYSRVLDIARRKVKNLVLIGEASDRIYSVFSGSINISRADSLKDAVVKAFTLSKKGDCVLFSPMCKSFDMFANYEERGKSFKALVGELKS
ncbi:MAG: UDP-N-acetylmuramoylalanine--D-glutamate ligase [Candidatus Omnitrophica bacterium ADurb.Bin205]|nr:MAG: UDP-N-acetylmuramoylalanine--D-glutamate ligase [Candidatus Omnitrophica bacterium ADurb.Bin205]